MSASCKKLEETRARWALLYHMVCINERHLISVNFCKQKRKHAFSRCRPLRSQPQPHPAQPEGRGRDLSAPAASASLKQDFNCTAAQRTRPCRSGGAFIERPLRFQQQKPMPFTDADHTNSHLESTALLPFEFLHQWKQHAWYLVQIYHFQELRAISKYIHQYKRESAINL